VVATLVAAGGCDLGSGGEDGGGTGDARSGPARAQLVERLRRGGHAIVFRHAATEPGMDTTSDLTDCSRQRNLNAEGRRQSRSIGRAFRRLGIPVGRVLASPFCRTRDTARLAFGRGRTSRALLSPEFFPSTREGRRRGLRRLLAARPPGRSNAVLVTHGSAIFDATGLNPEEGDAVVTAPRRGGRGYAVVSTVKAEDWARMAPGRDQSSSSPPPRQLLGAWPTGSKQRALPWFELPSRNLIRSTSRSNRPSYSSTYRPLRRSTT
jgi:phosphohistidine phosphatase SixA